MHPQRDHAWSVRHVTMIRNVNMDGETLFRIDHTSGENGFPLQVGEFLTLPNELTYSVMSRKLRYESKQDKGVFYTTAYLDVYVRRCY